MNVELLKTIPISGTYQEKHFNPASKWVWVKFNVDGIDDWIGSFGAGESSNSCAMMCSGGKIAFVLAGGRGYFVDVESQKLISKTETDYFRSAVALPFDNLVLACDFTNLYVIGTEGNVWKSGRVSIDGIRLEAVTNSHVSGQVRLFEEWTPFILEIPDWQYRSKFKYEDYTDSRKEALWRILEKYDAEKSRDPDALFLLEPWSDSFAVLCTQDSLPALFSDRRPLSGQGQMYQQVEHLYFVGRCHWLQPEGQGEIIGVSLRTDVEPSGGRKYTYSKTHRRRLRQQNRPEDVAWITEKINWLWQQALPSSPPPKIVLEEKLKDLHWDEYEDHGQWMD